MTRNKYLNLSPEFKNICFSEKKHKNTSLIKKTVKILKYKYDQKLKFIFQIIKELSKSRKNNPQYGWILNMKDENKLELFFNIDYQNVILINTLSNEFNFLILNKQEQEIVLNLFNEQENEIELVSKEKVTIIYSLIKNNYKTNLNLKQKINGTIKAIIITDDDMVFNKVLLYQ